MKNWRKGEKFHRISTWLRKSSAEEENLQVVFTFGNLLSGTEIQIGLLLHCLRKFSVYRMKCLMCRLGNRRVRVSDFSL